MDDPFYCSLTISLKHLVDFSFAPQLLFYSYIPIIVVSLVFGFFVFFKSQRSVNARNLLYIAIVFSLFLLNEIVQWIAIPASLVNFGWLLSPLLQSLVWFFTIRFFYQFLEDRVLPWKWNLFLMMLFLPIIFSLPTRLNIAFFDLVNCEGTVGPIWYYLYSLQIVSIITLFIWGMIKYKRNKVDNLKRQILLLSIGVPIFLLSFSLSNILGEVLQTYQINLVGPIGMALFIVLLGYLIVHYHIFNIRVIAAKVLVITLVILISSQFFFIRNNTNKILTAITLLLVAIFGWQLAASVNREVKQKEELAKLAKSLERVNLRLQELDRQKTDFLSIASHQLRTPLSIMKGYVELIQDGAYGKIDKKLFGVLTEMDESNERLVKLVDEFLDITRIEQGRTKFSFGYFDMNKLAESVAKELTNRANDKGLEIICKPDKKIEKIYIDEEKVRHVIFNFVDNAIKYSSSGKIVITTEKEQKGITVRVKDQGFGFGTEDQANFYQKFYRGKNVAGTNVTGTGLGLYVCRKFIEAHSGHVWAHSKGMEEGSEFGFWIPLTKKTAEKANKILSK
ncbi:MAG TPA: hypothetical protein DEB09_05530 [Candidatus Magasanikbacteria bacterium]|nr:hypothetical protein [Candidatus Magasanikbacteria bacterium]